MRESGPIECGSSTIQMYTIGLLKLKQSNLFTYVPSFVTLACFLLRIKGTESPASCTVARPCCSVATVCPAVFGCSYPCNPAPRRSVAGAPNRLELMLIEILLK